MTFRFKVCKTKLVDKGPGIMLRGPIVTPSLHDMVLTMFSDKDIRSEIYKAFRGVGAFFQGGIDNRDGQYIFIELHKSDDPATIKEFERILNKYLSPFLIQPFTEIRIHPDIEGAYYYFTEIAKECNVGYHGGSWNSPMVFFPENNQQWWKVYDLCKHMGLNVTYPEL